MISLDEYYQYENALKRVLNNQATPGFGFSVILAKAKIIDNWVQIAKEAFITGISDWFTKEVGINYRELHKENPQVAIIIQHMYDAGYYAIKHSAYQDFRDVIAELGLDHIFQVP